MQNISSLISFCKENKYMYEENAIMKNHTTFKVGGIADIIVEPSSEKDIIDILEFNKKNAIDTLIMGNGSNILVSDDGIRGCVIALGKNISSIKLLDETTIYAEAGASLSALCNFALEQSLTGLEFSFGIPGTVGGAIRMNAGAYGGEVKDVIFSSSSVSENGIVSTLSLDEMQMSYRNSIFCKNNSIITSGIFKLTKGDKCEIKSKMAELINKRKEKQPLEYPNAGSTFKRPEGAYASELIDRCGLKGYCIGDACVSEKHAGFVVNKGNATSNDVSLLIDNVKKIVKEKTGYSLETEIIIL